MSAEKRYAVVETEPCAWTEHGFNLCDIERGADEREDLTCVGCLTDGTRAVLDTAHTVYRVSGRMWALNDGPEPWSSGGVW